MSDNPESKNNMKSLKLDVDPGSINKSQLNSSSSKMQYSIPRSNRFSEKKINSSTDQFYQIPDTKAKRSASFGLGNKMDLSKQNFIRPSPNQYSLNSQFLNDKKKGITISAGRQIIKNNSVFGSPKHVPGPGQYNPKNPFTDLKENSGYKIGQRSVDFSDKWQKSIPGPGNYETICLLDKHQKTSNSKIQNVQSYKFSKSKRESDFEQIIKQKVPAPGQYQKAYNIGITAKYSDNNGSKFSKCPRKGIIDDSQMKIPGPGSYQCFSEFLH